MIDASAQIAALFAARPQEQFIANLYTIQTTSGTTYRYTNAPRSIVLGGLTYKAARVKLAAGQIKLSRGVSIDSHKVSLTEQDGSVLDMIEAGYWNLATYTLARCFAASSSSPWLGPLVRFVGIIGSIDEINPPSAQFAVKSMLYLLDNQFPRNLIQTDCANVLYSPGCGLAKANYLQVGTVAVGSTGNTILSNLGAVDDYYDQGIIKFRTGALSGIAYMVKKSLQANGTIYPAYPLLQVPAAGDTFEISAGCDKTLTTCQTKFGYNATSGAAPYFRATPFVPDPTTAY